MNYGPPTHLDLFSGIGGFSLAFESAGFRTIGFSEIDPYACAVLERHWPGIKNYGDIKQISTEPLCGGIDVLTGGIPCQPWSAAGKRRGKADDRHLWPAMLRFIRGTRPTWLCCENVSGFVGMVLDDVLVDMENEGYQCASFLVPACAVGAQHERERVWIVAHCDGLRELQSEGSKQDERGRIGDGDSKSFSGGSQNISDSHRKGLERNEEHFSGERGTEQSESRHDHSDVSDAVSVGRNASEIYGSIIGQSCEAKSDSRPRIVTEQIISFPPVGEPLETLLTPDTCGKPYGLPDGAHRIRCLGNAIVPQVATVFAKAIFEEIQKERKRHNSNGLTDYKKT